MACSRKYPDSFRAASARVSCTMSEGSSRGASLRSAAPRSSAEPIPVLLEQAPYRGDIALGCIVQQSVDFEIRGRWAVFVIGHAHSDFKQDVSADLILTATVIVLQPSDGVV